MSSLEKAVETQLSYIQMKIGMSLDELADIVGRTGLTEHSKIRSMFQREYGLGYEDATALVHAIAKPDGQRAVK